MKICLSAEAFDPWQEIVRHQAGGQAGMGGKIGATAVFVGTLRDFNQGAGVQAMTLEHYPAMTEKYLQRVAAEAVARWPIEDLLVIHRYGELGPALFEQPQVGLRGGVGGASRSSIRRLSICDR